MKCLKLNKMHGIKMNITIGKSEKNLSGIMNLMNLFISLMIKT